MHLHYLPLLLVFATKPARICGLLNNHQRRANTQRSTSSRLVEPLWAVGKNTTQKTSVLEEIAGASSVRPQSLQGCLEELHQKSSQGDKLSQEFCDATIGLCVAAEEWESVLEVLEVMKQQNMTQEHSTYRVCLQHCFEVGNGASALDIVQAMELAQIPSTPDDISLVAAAMCRNNRKEKGWWKQALDLLLSRPSPDVPIDAYDAVLSCLVDERNWKESIRLLRRLEQSSSSKNKNTLPEPTMTTYREVIECCVAADQLEQALQILKSMMERPNDNNNKLKPTVYTFELVISALSKKLQWRRALQLLDLMDEAGVDKSVRTYNTLISACARGNEIGVAKNLLSRMKKEGIRPSVVTYNSLVSACASAGRWQDAMQFLNQCHGDPYCDPDIYTFTNAIRACAKAGKTDRALSVHEAVVKKKIPLDSYYYAAVIEAAANSKRWKLALELLDEMEKEGIPPTDFVYSLTIKACGNAGKWREALTLLDTMRSKGLRINLITRNAAIAALAKAAKRSSKRQTTNESDDDSEKDMLYVRALEIMDQMKADGITPDGFSFSSAISCCGAEGKWEEALNLMDLMKKGGPPTRPNKIAYTAAIDACGRSGEYMHALHLFRNMTSEGLAADRMAWNTLFSAFRVSDKPDLAYELWGEMCNPPTPSKTSKVPANNQQRTTPDIITVTDVIATLSGDDANSEKIDEVFVDAVKRGIIFGSHFDSIWEVDLSGLSFPVAKAACRFVVSRVLVHNSVKEGAELRELNLITGVGANLGQGGRGKPKTAVSLVANNDKNKPLSLRDYVQEVLLEDLNLKSDVPKLAQGTVQIDKSVLSQWIERNS